MGGRLSRSKCEQLMLQMTLKLSLGVQWLLGILGCHSKNSDEGEHRHEETDIERVDKIDTIEETVADQEHEPFRFSSFGPFANCAEHFPFLFSWFNRTLT